MKHVLWRWAAALLLGLTAGAMWRCAETAPGEPTPEPPAEVFTTP